ncbi:MAG: fluoride efflux transporter CrcB [Pseudomonadota bacterium]
MSALLQVAIGGAVGASARYLTGLLMLRAFGQTPFPLAILSVNVLGSFLMGVFVVAASHRGLTHLSPLVMTGLLGGFTTFSAFSLETVTLWERGATAQAALYVVASVCLSVAGLVAGIAVARALFP